jgi:hypothetical protein
MCLMCTVFIILVKISQFIKWADLKKNHPMEIVILKVQGFCYVLLCEPSETAELALGQLIYLFIFFLQICLWHRNLKTCFLRW